MTATAQMLESHPLDIGPDQDKLRACIESCVECAQVCTSCADACLSEKMVSDLTGCISDSLDCADVCEATGKVLTRQTAWNVDVVSAMLEACATACMACGDECEQHASMHEHCKVCAASCHRCEQACRDLLSAL